MQAVGQSPMAGDNTAEDGSKDFFNLLASRGINFLLSSQGQHGLLFSANWCRPCKTFAPQLMQLYHTLKSEGRSLQIVFVSFDQDEDQFEEHFMSMPWLAVPFEPQIASNAEEHLPSSPNPNVDPIGLRWNHS
ncbi:unnamed protein product [Linum tenue]|uniref:protein-disulfide reductase n=1 Tax=Linum tenue TaxID=586396 RepID=A0AAV0LWH8_9ROSI|nr:unnamed protein product [Linum tenue]